MARPSKHTVFYLEDHPLMLDAVSKLFENHPNFRIIGHASTVKDGLLFCKENRPDLIIVDLSLNSAGTEGFDFINCIINGCDSPIKLKRNPDAKILVYSQHEAPSIVSKAWKSGALGYVSKRCSQDALLEGLLAVAKGEKYIAPDLAQHITLLGAFPDTSADLAQLSEMEYEVFKLVADGWKTKEIAESLRIAENTVKTYSSRIRKKLNVKKSFEFTTIAMKENLPLENVPSYVAVKPDS